MRKRLEDLFQGIAVLEKQHWDPKRIIHKITSDSRAVESGDIFVACRGNRMDGHDFLSQAIYAKAAVVVFEKEPDIMIPPHVTGVRVRDSRVALAVLLNRFYDCPDQKVKLIGVTGTNGKTTTSYLLHRLLREKGPTAYLGTLWYELPTGKVTSVNTTPGPEVLIPMFHQMEEEGVKHCLMEVSSHAIDQKRVYGLEFELGIFTQLTQDHLDYHHSMEHYFQTKRDFFASVTPPRKMLFNKDCPYGRRLIEEWPEAKTYSVLGEADYCIKDLKMSFQGSRFLLCCNGQEISFQIRLPMRYNVSNALTILAAIDLLGFDLQDFRGALEEIPAIPGRMERVGTGTDFTVFVDYAHTPDAFEQVLHDAKQMESKRIITVFGCGGDRDKGKRPLMTRAACAYSDIVIMTTDNPRSEDPEEIFRDMRKGLPHPVPAEGRIKEIQDREEAIQQAIAIAKAGDVIFVLGKGHEEYQILADGKVPFSDREVVEAALKRKSRVFLS
ncbi:MAG TPA: UDP-N-acetylmuramoyl-L-alanyl-D-glutamate--2,6-diaminopimelate ligase [Candidatus Omnitrophota bacterium]|nr:UDP-N-acetylmuramoyl-L-alanyl-D-glutamate--2,6-diaminopimelate ligase [Candidatus Omnitrophota bacterium]HPS36761.1 UDP-N-acetylmuramoyl-L-alanyl-D-glutamate--2,6-diaminopimelate ligase [Candidatus Omnitrophota bacterium]